MSTEICSAVVQQENMLSLTETLHGTECLSAVPLASTGWRWTSWATWVTTVSWTSWSSALQRRKGVNLSSYLTVLNLASTNPFLYFCIGWHRTNLSFCNKPSTSAEILLFSTLPTGFQERRARVYFSSCPWGKTVLMQKGHTALALVFFTFCH